MSIGNPIPPNVAPRPKRDIAWIFVGPHGLRALWSLLIYFVLVAVIGTGLTKLLHPIFGNVNVMAPKGMIFAETLVFLVVLIPALIMARLEGRPAGAYGLPLRHAFGRHFWTGAFWGLVLLCAVMLCMRLAHAYTFGPIALAPMEILKYGALWLIGFLMVGFFEEYCFRGYVLYTMTRGLGFWPAAILTSCVFAWVHKSNPGETWFGLSEIVVIALVFAVAVQRTGSLWWAVGMHMSYDWGESFLFSVPNSGTHVVGHLSNSTLSGNRWLSGGTVGPEATVFNLIGELALLVFVLWRYPTVNYPTAVKEAEVLEMPAIRSELNSSEQ
jgi:membrane protease YdiL (CAAX protease family)